MVNREVLINFINKYNLDSGSSRGETAVILKVENGMLATMLKTEDKSLMAQVVASKTGIPDGKYAVYNTSTLLSLIKLMQTEFELTPIGSAEKPMSWRLKDDNYDAEFRLASPDIISSSSVNLKLPEMQLNLEINSVFIDKYIKSLAALPSTLISFINKKGMVFLTVNHSDSNSHKIQIPLNVEAPEELISPIVFDANKFKDVLTVNKDATSGKLALSTSGLMSLEFKTESIISKYYLVSKID
jgi:hypothetical protein